MSDEEDKEDAPEVLRAQPFAYQQSPTKELMDRHHDMDALTAHQNQIQVYQPGDHESEDNQEEEKDTSLKAKVNEKYSLQKKANHYSRGSFNGERQIEVFEHFKVESKTDENAHSLAETEQSSAVFGEGDELATEQKKIEEEK